MLFVCFLIAFTFLVYFIFARKKAKGPLPPGPKGTPLIGVLRELEPKTAHLTLAKWASHGKVYSFSVFGITSVVISDVQLIRKAFSSEQFQTVLNDRPDTFVGKHLTFNYSDVGFAKYHEATVKLRKCLHKALHFYGDGVKRFETLFTNELCNLTEEYRKSSDQFVDPREALERSFCRLISVLLLGRTLTKEDTVTTDLMWNYLNNVNKLLDPTLDTIMQNLPFLRFVPSGFRTFFNDVMGKRDKILDFFFEQQKTEYNPKHERGLVDALLRIQGEDGKGLTDEHVMGLILDSLGGGLLTSTNGILAILLILINNPDIQSKIYEEVSTVVGTDRFLQFADRAYMPYLEAVVLESLRYTTHFPLMPHCCMKDTYFEGYLIPKNAQIFANLWHVHHDPEIWPDPWNVKPERFLDDEGRLLPSNSPQRYNHISFGVGPRSCLGESLAKSRLVLYVGTLVQQFDIQPGPDRVSDDPRQFNGGIILEPPKFLCKFIPRKHTHIRGDL